MKLMALADTESPALWDYFDSNHLEGVDLILSCGDLDPNYLSFLVTMGNVPVIYVPGNHDSCYSRTPPEGCICIDDRIYVHNGVRILGLGGSIRYGDAPNMYTQSEMRHRCRRLWLQFKRYGGFDILLTHAPAYDLPPSEDFAHTGFEAFVELLDKYQPKYMVHGHIHLTYSRRYPRVSEYQNTRIINAYERYTWDY